MPTYGVKAGGVNSDGRRGFEWEPAALPGEGRRARLMQQIERLEAELAEARESLEEGFGELG